MDSVTINYIKGTVYFPKQGNISFYKNLNDFTNLKKEIERLVQLANIKESDRWQYYWQIDELRFSGVNLQDLFQRFLIYPDAYIIKCHKHGYYYSSQNEYNKHFHSWAFHDIIPYKKAVQQLITEMSPKY